MSVNVSLVLFGVSPWHFPNVPIGPQCLPDATQSPPNIFLMLTPSSLSFYIFLSIPCHLTDKKSQCPLVFPNIYHHPPSSIQHYLMLSTSSPSSLGIFPTSPHRLNFFLNVHAKRSKWVCVAPFSMNVFVLLIGFWDSFARRYSYNYCTFKLYIGLEQPIKYLWWHCHRGGTCCQW